MIRTFPLWHWAGLALCFALAGSACQPSRRSAGNDSDGDHAYGDIPNRADDDDNDTTQEDDDAGDDDTTEDTDGEGGAGTLTLPFAPNEAWQLTRGYNTGSHMDYGYDWVDDTYALDFSLPGCAAWRKPIRPIRSGTVEVVGFDDDGYGHYVLLNHENGYKSRYAHFDEVLVDQGDTVTVNNEIGLTGYSGNVKGSACPAHPGTHLHLAYYRNGNGIPPEPMSGHVNFTAGCWYGHNGWLDCNGDNVSEDDDDAADDDDVTPPPADDDDVTPPPADDDDVTPPPADDDDDVTPPPADDDDDVTPPPADDDDDVTPPPADDDDDVTPPPADDDDVTPPPADDDDVTPPPDPCTWTVPTDTSTIQSALNLAGASGADGWTVCVEPGAYTGDLIFPNVEVSLVSTGGASQTHLYGVGTALYDAAITISGGQSRASVVQGFTVHGSGSSVIWVEAASPTLKNLEIEAAGATTGLGFFASSALVRNVHVENADDYGVTAWGGSVGLTLENVIVENNGFEGLRTGGGSDLTITNAVFHGNANAGIRLYDTVLVLMNSTVTSHTVAGVMRDEPSYLFASSHNSYYGNAVPLINGVMGVGDDTLNPLFGSTWADDFTLQAGSPAINAGNPASPYNDANGSRNDKGAYGGPLSTSW